ncbi:MAG TPA: alpha/beta hydrolase [Casimicrobiaceae bacterium]
MPYLAIDAGSLYYEVHGRGYPVLLFAPGFLSSRIERWATNPAKPAVPQDWLDPVPALQDRFTLIALDVRNAGRSRAELKPTDDWETYADDFLALVDHLGVARFHAFGACIGVSFALSVAKRRPSAVTSLVLQNPIGLSKVNRQALDTEFDKWAQEIRDWPNIDPSLLPGFHDRMFGGDFIFSVTREFVRSCAIPMLLMPGNDLVHAANVSEDLAKAPRVEMLVPWKGVELRVEAMQRVREFLLRHTP